MKKLRFLFLLIPALLLLSGCATLLNNILPEGAKDYFSNLYLQYEQSAEGTDAGEEQIYQEDNNSYGYYYDQLSENSKVVYRSIYLDNKNRGGITIVFRQPLVFVSAEGEEEADMTVRNGISSLVQPALDALLYDHPEIFWISMDENSGSTFHISSRRVKDEKGIITLTVKKMTFHMVYKDKYTDKCIAAEEKALKDATLIAGLGIENTTSRYEILYTLHNYLCKTVSYNSDTRRAHEVAGALIDGAAVCDGYAKAFKLLCDAYEIPCLIVTGSAIQNGKTEAHAWNCVQMEDNNWYAIDVTWDDRGETADTNYFLIGSGTVTSLTLGHFDNSHRASGKFSAGEYLPFTFPELSFFRYNVPLIPNEWMKKELN